MTSARNLSCAFHSIPFIFLFLQLKPFTNARVHPPSKTAIDEADRKALAEAAATKLAEDEAIRNAVAEEKAHKVRLCMYT